MNAQAFNRTFAVGSLPAYHYRTGAELLARLWITVNYIVKDGKGRLSISGVHGPMGNGDCHGSAGQCVDTLRELIDGPEENIFLPGGREAAIKLASAWEQWHLNDMRAYCDHQKAVHGWNISEQLVIWKWRLDAQTCRARREIENSAKRQLLEGQQVQYTEAERQLLALPYWAYTYTEAAPDDRYEPDGKETKAAGWVYPLESMKGGAHPGPGDCHPRGLLTKPCPTCGHKYGSAWLHAEVPDDVLEFLASLPDNWEAYPWKN